jgi:F0F1-type ATP synthase epsilon subunit
MTETLMADTFQLEIVTPEKKVVDTAATEAQIPGKNGYLGMSAGPRAADHRTGGR